MKKKLLIIIVIFIAIYLVLNKYPKFIENEVPKDIDEWEKENPYWPIG